MREISSDYFSIKVDESLQFFIDDIDEELKAPTLYFTRKKSMHTNMDDSMIGSIELVAGNGDEIRELIYLSAEREALVMGGQISEAEISQSGMVFSTYFDFEGKEFRQTHLISQSAKSFCLYVKFLQGHSDIDMKEMEEALGAVAILKEAQSQESGVILNLSFDEGQIEFKIGNRRILRQLID